MRTRMNAWKHGLRSTGSIEAERSASQLLRELESRKERVMYEPEPDWRARVCHEIDLLLGEQADA